MTEKRPLFRPEAVEYHARARTTGRTLDLKERRTVWMFRGALCALVAIVLLAFALSAETTAHGTANVAPNGTEAVVVLTDVRRIETGQRVTVDVGGRTVPGTVTGVGFPVRVSLSEPAPPGSRGPASIKLGRTSVAKLLLGKG